MPSAARWTRRSRTTPSSRRAAGAAALVVVVIGAAVLAGVGDLAALKAAGLFKEAPAGATTLQTMIDTLKGNAEWIIATGIGLAMTVVFGLVIFGSQRAPESLFKILFGVAGLLVIIPAVAA